MSNRPLSRLGGLFLAPADPAAPAKASTRAAAASGPAPAAAVLGSVSEAPAVAALLAAELRLRCRADCVLLGEWRAGGPAGARPAMASRGARALALRLQGRGLEAAAAGRLVRLSLPADPEGAVQDWSRAVAAADCPLVLAVAGAWPPAFAGLLGEQDLLALVLGGPAAHLGPLAAEGLAGARAPVVCVAPVPAGVARLAASSSLATSRALGAEVTRAVRALA